MTQQAPGTLVLIDADPAVTASFAEVTTRRVSTPGEIADAFATAPSGARWVAPTVESLVIPLADMIETVGHRARTRRYDALVLSGGPAEGSGGVSFARQQTLLALFETVVYVGRDPDQHAARFYLPPDQIAEALGAEHPGDYVIGGEVDRADQLLVLRRGTLEPLIVPFNFFRPAGSGLAPDFSDFEVIDYGQSLRFGRYESSVDVVLYAYDSDYRRRAKARELAHDASSGAAFKRLRLLRGLGQGDFPPLDARTIRRIEQNEGGVLRAGTKRILTKRLGLPFDEIATY